MILDGDGTTIYFTPPDVPELKLGALPYDGEAVVFVPQGGPKGDQGEAGSLNDLNAVQDMIDTTVTVHVNAPTPHPAYDDIVDLAIVFENGLI